MLKEEEQDKSLQLLPHKIVVDFELGLMQAVELQFPMANIQGCFYHSHCIWRDASFKYFVRKMTALSFCPTSMANLFPLPLF